MSDFCLVDKNIIHQDNCLNIIDMLPDNYIDAIITDFPYGIDYQSNHRKIKFDKIHNDEKPYIEWIKPVFPKLKDEGRLICFYRYDVQEELFDELREAGFTIKSQLVWDKDNWSAGDLEAAFGLQHELMVYATKGVYKFKNGRPSSIYKCPRVSSNKMVHPNEKPVALNIKLIEDITTVGELILEPFSGSGSLAVAAKQTGRNFIACDLGAEYVAIGNERLKNVSKSLF